MAKQPSVGNKAAVTTKPAKSHAWLWILVIVVPLLLIGAAIYGGYKLYTSEYFNPQDITHLDSRIAPLKDEMVAWEKSLVEPDWQPIANNESSEKITKDSELTGRSHFGFPRSSANDPVINGWLSQSEHDSPNYYVNITLAHSWKPPFNTQAGFKEWVSRKFPSDKIECDSDYRCEIKSPTGVDNNSREYSVCFNSLHSYCSIIQDSEGPSVFFILNQQKTAGDF